MSNQPGRFVFVLNPLPGFEGYSDGSSVEDDAPAGGLRGTDNIQLAAKGDLRCDACESGGSYGTSAMYNIEGKNLCSDCAVKSMELGGAPGSLKIKKLGPHLIK